MSGADSLREWADDVRTFAQDWPARGARAAADRIEQVLASDTGGDGRLRNHPGAATVSIEAGDGEAAARADGDLGIWAILEDGTKAHAIHARPGGFLSTPFGPRRFVTVRGVAARETWTKGAELGLVEAERDAEAAFDEATS